MNRLSKETILVLIIFVTMLLLCTGCDKSKPGKKAISDELQQMWPIWKQGDLEINKMPGSAAMYTNEVYLKPKYYNGKMPLVYTSTKSVLGMTMGMGMSAPEIFYSYEFNDFSNYFIYENFFLLKGVVAINKSNTLVAEARIEWQKDPKSSFSRPIMEEFHYSKGMLVFHCKSEIDYTGTKVSEYDQSGSKRRDYFFLLPIY